MTWSMWWHEAPVEDNMVVSDMGEQWSPKTAPAITAAKPGISIVVSIAMVISAAKGSIMPKVPQLVPVDKAITPARINSKVGSRYKGMFCCTKEAKYFPVSSWPIKLAVIHASNNM